MNSTAHEIAQILAVPSGDDSVLPEAGAGILIYGAGKCGRDVRTVLVKAGYRIVAFLDLHVPAGSLVDGVTVRRPDDVVITPFSRRDVVVVVGVFNFAADIAGLVATLHSLGYQRIVTFPQLHRQFSTEFGDRFWLTHPDRYQKWLQPAVEALDLWADQDSRDLYREILRFRCSADYSLLSPPSSELQYFDRSVPGLGRPDHFIDCGGYIGDTIGELFRTFGKVKSIVAFEPDLANFARLSETVASYEEAVAASVSLYPCGVWSGVSYLRFNAVADGSSTVSGDGKAVIQCVSLDRVLPVACPTFIKMDIEGAEPDALRGAETMIRRARPTLAISAYHAPDHLWTIPLYLRSLDLGYRLFLRCYNYSTFDAVCYAIPG